MALKLARWILKTFKVVDKEQTQLHFLVFLVFVSWPVYPILWLMEWWNDDGVFLCFCFVAVAVVRPVMHFVQSAWERLFGCTGRGWFVSYIQFFAWTVAMDYFLLHGKLFPLESDDWAYLVLPICCCPWKDAALLRGYLWGGVPGVLELFRLLTVCPWMDTCM